MASLLSLLPSFIPSHPSFQLQKKSLDNKYSTATSITGPWSAWQDFAPAGTNTFSSQTNFILPTGNGNYIYMGDRWVSTNLMSSTYVWLPLTISGNLSTHTFHGNPDSFPRLNLTINHIIILIGTTASMPTNYLNWIVNPSTGAWSAGPSENWYEGEAATFANGAKIVACTGCSGAEAAGYIGGSAGGTVTFSGVQSTVATTTSIRVKNEVCSRSSFFISVRQNLEN